MYHASRNTHNLLDLFFPIRCLGCHAFDVGYLCKRCLNQIPRSRGPECIGCKKAVPLGKTCYFCEKDNHIDQLFIASNYDFSMLAKAIKVFKYRFISDLSDPLSNLLKNHCRWLLRKRKFNLLEQNPVVLSVPLHPRRLNWRGFNQSELLASKLSQNLQLGFLPGVLKRIRNDIPQADLSEREERINNARGQFVINSEEEISGRNILLIDDVCTTGATLNECARVLKEAGATKVMALVVARG